jgi:hypothetical protein
MFKIFKRTPTQITTEDRYQAVCERVAAWYASTDHKHTGISCACAQKDYAMKVPTYLADKI